MSTTVSLLLLLAVTSSLAYRFDCMDGCTCDTADEAIHCHNLALREVPLPDTGRLRGFTVLGVTGNRIDRLPAERTLKTSFPDLIAIDMEGNAEFDCRTMPLFAKITVFSDCENSTLLGMRPSRLIPPIGRATESCDLGCQIEKHYEKLHLYVIDFWKKVKVVFGNIDIDKNDVKQVLTDVKVFIKKLFGED